MPKLLKIDKQHIKEGEKKIDLVRIHPDFHDKSISFYDEKSSKKREKALLRGIEIPSWNSPKTFAPSEHLLSKKLKGEFKKNKSIWFNDATPHLKEQFLNAVEKGLRDFYSQQRNYPTDISPKDIRDGLTKKTKAIKNIKKQLETITGMQMHKADNTYTKLCIASNFVSHCDPEQLHNVYGYNFRALLTEAWTNLDDIERTLKTAASKITISKTNKPTSKETHELILRLAKDWFYLTDEYPPHSKEGRFYLFLEELGEKFQIKITSHTVSKVVKSFKDKDLPPV